MEFEDRIRNELGSARDGFVPSASLEGQITRRVHRRVRLDAVEVGLLVPVHRGDDPQLGMEHVDQLRTSDGGDTWRDLSGNLTDINVSTLLIDPDATPRVVYAGTDFGVFRATDDGSGRWEGFNNGLPPVVVTRFAYNAVTRTLLAATYGRGVWAIGNLTAAQSRSSAGAAR
jgi:hypothetical protein